MSGDRPDTGESLGAGSPPPRRTIIRTIIAMAPWRLVERADLVERRLDAVEQRLDAIEHALGLIDERAGAAEARLDGVEGRADGLGSELGKAAVRLDAGEKGRRELQGLIEDLGTNRVAAIEDRVDHMETGLGKTDSEVARLRDGLVPAAIRRSDVLLQRLSLEIEETASLVERSLLAEPLPVLTSTAAEHCIARSLSKIQPALLEVLRGSEEEISHRLAANLPLVRDHAPVLDLGCGRGEFLVLLREAGIEALGVEGDGALAQGARRRGLDLREGDVLEVLRDLEDDSFGAVTAMHLLEHLGPGTVLEVLAEARRVLQPGGVLIVECPNPHSLRVGGALFWLDPTHVRPLLPETLQLLLRASGYEVMTLEFRHPFPDDQLLAGQGDLGPESDALSRRIAEVERRFDAVISGPRDFLMAAQKPGS